MVVVPLVNKAAAQALCIELLEAGAWMVPFNAPFPNDVMLALYDFADDIPGDTRTGIV